MASEIRKDPLSQRWVIIAAERANRPSDFTLDVPDSAPQFDPFAPGNETKTPHEIAAFRPADSKPDSPGWKVRVVPNKFPALTVEGNLSKRGDGMYDRIHGIGAHEVIIDAPETVRSVSELSDSQVREMLMMYRDRLQDLRKDPRLKYGLIFKNVGSAAGATMFHSHSQLVVTPTVPQAVAQKIHSCQEYYGFRGRCLLCDMIQQELEQSQRVVIESESFLAFEPYAPRTPFETWIFPRTHASHFEDFTAKEADDLAVVLRRTITKLERALGTIAYNYMLCTAPFDAGSLPHFHWHLEIVPRLTKQAGFEWGSGMYINPVPPEGAAEFLRSVKA